MGFSKDFCKHNDSNWDWTFQYSLQHLLKEPLEIVYPLVSRVKHIGLW